MTRVDFYILKETGDDARWDVVYRIIQKAFRQGNRMLVNTASHTVAHKIDTLLWSLHPDSFLPHELLPAGKQSPVHIGCGEDSPHHHDLLINLGNTIPGFFSRFERVIEIVTQDPDQLAESRQRFRFYRERGYALDTINLPARSNPAQGLAGSA